MNENLPPSESGEQRSPSLPVKNETKPPKFGVLFGIGILLFIVSVLLCIPFQSPTIFFYGGVAAFVTVFFKGYRGVFVGYISTLGLALLAAIAYCSIYPVRFD